MDSAGPRAVNLLGRLNADVNLSYRTGEVFQTLHAGRLVHIIAIRADGRMLNRLHNGNEGYIPAGAADDVGEWAGSAPECSGSP